MMRSRFLPLLRRPLTLQWQAFMSTSPDYVNYETWHRKNYEDGIRSGLHVTNGEHHSQEWNSKGKHGANFNIPHNSTNALEWNSGTQSSNVADLPRTSVLMELSDRVGALHDVLKYL
jgi:hypothetical protein